MPGLTLTFFGLAVAATHAAAAIAFGSYLCGGNEDGPLNYSTSSHNRRTTRIQTQPSHRPPPLRPSYTYRPSETYNQTTPRTPVPADLGRGVYQTSSVSPYTRTPSQTQPSSTRTQPSIAKSASTSSRVLSCVPTERDPLLPPVTRSVSRSNVLPYTRTPGQTQLSSTRTQPSSTLAEPSSTHPSITQSASASPRVPSSVPIKRDPLPRTVANGVYHTSAVSPYTRTPSQAHQSSIVVLPSSSRLQLSSTASQPSSSNIQSSSTLTQASHQRLSLINKVHVHEPPEYEVSQARSQVHVLASVHTRNEPPSPAVNQVIVSEVRSGEPASVEDLNFAEKLRVQARQRGRDMSEARNRAKSAQKKGYKGAAQAHRQEAIAHEKVMKELDKRAAKIIFREKNKVGHFMGIRRDLPKSYSQPSLSLES